jgi:DNA-binding beta-propeller fold protein YncE
VADTQNHVLRAIVPAADPGAWTVATLAGKVGESGADDGVDGTFDSPYALTATPERLYVADFMGHTVRSVDLATRAVATLAGRNNRVPARDGVGGAAALERPRALAVGGGADQARAWMIDQRRVIREVRLDTGMVTTIAGDAAVEALDDGIGTAAHFAQPSGLAYDDGLLYIVDPGRVTDPSAPLLTPPGFAPLRQLETTSRVVTTLPLTLDYEDLDLGRTPRPQDVAAAGGVVYLSDRSAGIILRYEVAGDALSVLAGAAWQTGTIDGIGADARFTGPSGLALDVAGGRLFVAEQAKNVVRVIALASGEVTTVAGLAGTLGAVDGGIAAATFREPQALAFADGTLFVADRGNSLLRAIDTVAGTVRTVAGVAGARGFTPGPLPGGLNRPCAVALAGSAVLVVDEEESVLARVVP